MYDFLRVERKWDNKLQRNVYTPSFEIKSNIKDLLVRGYKFYAIYNYNTGLWETDDARAVELIDEQVRQYVEEKESAALREDPEHGPIIRRLSDQSNRTINTWHSFCEKDYRRDWDSRCQLNQKVIFSNTEVKRNDYASLKLDYPLQDCPTPYYDKLCEKLYLPSEQEKWEWFIGCIIAGDQRKIQKMLVFYGEPGTGKSTIIGKVIAEALFNGYETGYATKFEANNLAGRDSFATDFLEKDSVLCYDDDAELNIISSKTTLNKIISHEPIRVNAKYERPFITTPNCLLIVGSNEPVQLSPNSGMNRRLIDIRPTGEKLTPDEYDACIEHLQFEKSGIAWKCLQVYKKLGRHYYDHYIAEDMLSRTSPFQNFVQENYIKLKDGITLAAAYDMYTQYAEECKFKNILARYKFRDTLKLYFEKYEDFKFSGFKSEKIGIKPVEQTIPENQNESKPTSTWLNFSEQKSIFDSSYPESPAQYATDEGFPKTKWVNVKTSLKDLDTTKLHYVKIPPEHIVIDFDIKGADGQKNFEKNLEAASKFPPTYAELSKSNQGIHLHYIYTGGNPEELSRIYGDNIEVKVFTGNSSLRRKLTYCNDIPISVISSGLPLKEGAKNVIDWEGFKNERQLRATIVNCLMKKHHGHTKPECDLIYKVLKEAYNDPEKKSYDLRDLENDVFLFALNSKNKSDYCTDLVNQMHFASKDIEDEAKAKENFETQEYKNSPIIFLDVEISPSYKQAKEAGVKIPEDIPEDTPALFIVCWKYQGDDKKVVKMINPKPREVEDLFKYRIIGYNNRSYDNHMLWARSQGYSSEELYELSRRIIDKKDPKAKFAQAYNISYTDIYDFANNDEKITLKKWEIKLKEKHLEWNKPWDEPVAVKDWLRFANYCTNDVITTEHVFNKCKDSFIAREMLADLGGGTPNDTTNKLSTKFVKGNADHLQLIYTDFTTGKSYGDGVSFEMPIISQQEYEAIGDDWTGVTPVNSNHFPGYHLVRMDDGKLHNMYRGVDVGRGGYVYSNPGMYGRAVTKDVASMHPHSILALLLFGEQTIRYADIIQTRLYIKHKDFESAKKMFNGALAKYLDDPNTAKGVSTALKLVLNSFYGMTSSPNDYFEAKDPRNVNNIVALRGALVMKTLQDEVEKRGFKVIHIKTDSIKIANPTPEILQFIDDFGKKYGYTYEVEHTWEKICLIDKAQFIGRHDIDDPDYVDNPEKSEKDFPNRWEATGDYFQQPYIFKSLFTHQPIEFNDMCEILSVKAGALHLVFNEGTDTEQDDFIGRVGQFTPMKQYGGKLYRVDKGKRNAASGTKGYEWLESNAVEMCHYEDYICREYYQSKCDEAIEKLKSFGDYEWFVSTDDKTADFINYPMNTGATGDSVELPQTISA